MDNTPTVRRILWIILFANIAVAVIKIFLGKYTQSISMTADGYHSLTDGSSNVVALIGLAIASRPVDEKHPYGHGKFELLTGLFIGAMLLIVAQNIFTDAYARLYSPVIPEFGKGSIALLIVTLLINIFVWQYEMHRGHQLNSYFLIMDALHTKSDIFISVGVLVALFGIKIGLPPIIDPIVSIIVAFFILHAGWSIIKDTGGLLVDKAVLDHEQVEQIARGFCKVLDVHNIRSRGSGAQAFLDMHIKLDPMMPLQDAHGLAHDIEEALKAKLGSTLNVIIHTEPYRQKKYQKE